MDANQPRLDDDDRETITSMNIDLGDRQVLTSYRKIAIASWRHPRNPSTYAMLDLPVTPALDFLATFQSESPLTLTHFVTKIVAHCLDTYAELMPRDRFGSAMITNIGALGSHLLRHFKKISTHPADFRSLFEGKPTEALPDRGA